MYRPDNIPPDNPINVAICGGGMGDAIAALPVCKHIFNNYTKNHTITFWMPAYLKDLTKLALPGADVQSLSDIDKKWQNRATVLTYQNAFPTYLRMHLTDYSSVKLIDGLLPNEEKNYLKPDLRQITLPDYGYDLSKGVLITPYFTSRTRQMTSKLIDDISDYVLAKGYIPVYIGKSRTVVSDLNSENVIKGKHNDFDKTKGINLADRTSVLQCLKLISKSKAIIGIDNGLLHLAGMTNIPIIGGFTTVLPEARMPYRNNQLGWNYYPVTVKGLECLGCQSNWTFQTNLDFTKCYYGDYKCVQDLSIEHFKEALDKVL